MKNWFSIFFFVFGTLLGEDLMKAKELNVKGVSLLNTNPSEALTLFKEAMGLDSKTPDYPSNAGVALLNQKNYNEAISFFNKALEISPNHTSAHFNLGVCYQAMGDNQKSVQAYAKAVSLNPEMPEAYFNLGLVYSRLNNKKMAITNYQKFLKVANPSTMSKPIQDANNRIKQLSE
ncbi:MAG: tetratricopeptide repeat protein [Leptospiraceae bacterium]|nr:tetratricopeptide repeat protein [Leptospiraceae bacterium]